MKVTLAEIRWFDHLNETTLSILFMYQLKLVCYIILSTFEVRRFLLLTQEYLKEGVCNLSIDEAVQVGIYRNSLLFSLSLLLYKYQVSYLCFPDLSQISKRFLRQMAQPFDKVNLVFLLD